MEFVEVGDLSICCDIFGEGEPVVLIMGLTANMDWWDPGLLYALSQRYRVLMFDNRGAGRTVTPEVGQWTCEMFADDTVGLMEAKGFERAHLVGISMGGMIAQELVLKYPEKVNKLTLGCTFCGGKHTVPASKEVMQMLVDRSGGLKGMLERTLKLMFTEDYIKEHPEAAEAFKLAFTQAPISDANAARQFMATVSLDTFDRLPEIKAPTLVATGAEDILIPAENSRIIAGQIPGAKLAVYEGAAHAFIVQAREAFIEDLLEFLA
jgi:pimeloyl-ACP methyl ester carboxylesterase